MEYKSLNDSPKAVITCGWDEVAHLDEKTKAELLASTPPHLRDARSKGTPSMGVGAIYGFPESEIVVDPFAIPGFWPRIYALDVGWNRTAAIWLAHDQDTDTIYAYSEHYRAEAEASVHAAAINARGAWIPGVIDPAARARAQKDGEQLIAIYREHGLQIDIANNAVSAGIEEVRQRLGQGRLKVFATCRNWLAEFRLYRRDDKGKIVKKNDHLMDATRYGVLAIGSAKTQPIKKPNGSPFAADPVGGY